MASSSTPPRAKTPLPMVPVPQALETVLTEAARALWFDGNRRTSCASEDCGDGRSSAPHPPRRHERSLLGRISAADVAAPPPGYPDHHASIMDGYAVRTSDLAAAKAGYDAIADQEEREKFALDFAVAGRVYAGDDEDEGAEAKSSLPEKGHRTAVYVTTGAVVPDGYDAVVPIEDTEVAPSSSSDGAEEEQRHRMRIIPSKVLSVLDSTKPWTWIRPVGCDIPPGTIVLSEGETIQPVHLALLAQVGVSLDEVNVKRLPRVGVLSTGNELVASVKEAKQAGKIPDVNRPMLLSQLSAYGNCTPIDLGIVTDDDGLENITQRLNNVLWSEGEGVEVLITTGGISMGEKDIMAQVFVDGMGGDVHFGRMNMKPGKPTTFITIDREDEEAGRTRKLVFALPGNPVSASVCTELLVRPCLDLLHDGVDARSASVGVSQEEFVKSAANSARVHEEVMATITSDIKLDLGRPEYCRVSLQRVPVTGGAGTQQYTYHATTTGVQRSSRVLSLRGADGLMMLPRGGPSGCGYDVAKKGAEFPVLLRSSLSSSSSTRFGDSMHRAILKSKHHHAQTKQKLALAVVVVCSSEQHCGNDFVSIDETLVTSLGGDTSASVVQRAICRVDEESFAQQLSDAITGSQMDGANVIFVVVPTMESGSSAVAFKAGLEVSHALRPLLTKNAHAMALKVRKHAALQDPVAAIFENTVGTVRNNSSVLISCSDRGIEGAAGAVKGLLGHLVGLIGSTK